MYQGIFACLNGLSISVWNMINAASLEIIFAILDSITKIYHIVISDFTLVEQERKFDDSDEEFELL